MRIIADSGIGIKTEVFSYQLSVVSCQRNEWYSVIGYQFLAVSSYRSAIKGGRDREFAPTAELPNTLDISGRF